MRQLLQSVDKGRVRLTEVPPPRIRPNGVLVATAASLISPGTERAALEFSRMNLASKARSRPDLVRQVLDKVQRDGFVEAARAARARLERPVSPGYACAGTVIAVGREAAEFGVGDRVACAGAGYAGHAEVNYIPRNLAVPIPRDSEGGDLSFEEASFVTLGAVALHAVRLGRAAVGERAVVIGLGLLGLLAGQILRAAGCLVLGVDHNAARRDLARELGLSETGDPALAGGIVRSFTRGLGADLVLVTASASDSRPMRLAGEVARDRATVVAVGDTGLALPRRLYYRKELSLVVSRSYGPGRYDPNFEERGQDYPPGYVRWSERENMRAFLELVAGGRVRVRRLVSHRIPIEEAERAYELLDDPDTLGIVLSYPAAADGIEAAPRPPPARIELNPARRVRSGSVGVSLIGAGAFAQGILLPILKKLPGLELRGVVTGSGVTARWTGERLGFAFCASAPEAVWEDPGTEAVIVATRNDLHAELVRQAIVAGKAVFVEKPLCLSSQELGAISGAHEDARGSGARALVMVGFNRRFAPAVLAVKSFFVSTGAPLSVHYRVNAGRLPEGSWVADPTEGGGRILSEFCHFIDLCSFLVGAPPVTVLARRAAGGAEDLAVFLNFANGSLATIGFYADGDRSYSKERVEVFGAGGVAVLEDFRRGWLVRNGRRRRLGGRWGGQRKGHREEIAAFLSAVRDGRSSPVPFEDAVATTQATFAVLESLGRGAPVGVHV